MDMHCQRLYLCGSCEEVCGRRNRRRGFVSQIRRPAEVILEVEGESMSDEAAKDRSLKQEEPWTEAFRGALRSI